MIGKRLVNKLVAGLAAAASAFVAVIALGATLFYALCLVLPPLGAAAVTFAVFAVVTGLIAVVFLNGSSGGRHEDEDEEPESFAQKAVHLIRERPIVSAAGGLGILFFLLRNPALAAIAASMITEKRMESRGYGRRRR
jgi:predicted permease